MLALSWKIIFRIFYPDMIQSIRNEITKPIQIKANITIESFHPVKTQTNLVKIHHDVLNKF